MTEGPNPFSDAGAEEPLDSKFGGYEEALCEGSVLVSSLMFEASDADPTPLCRFEERDDS